MKTFDVIFVRCCPCFVDVIFDAMCLDKHSCFTNVEFADFVKSNMQGSFAIETSTMSGKILFSCFNDLDSVFTFDQKTCLCYNKRTFFTCTVDDDRNILRKCHRCYRRPLKSLLVNFSLFIR